MASLPRNARAPLSPLVALAGATLCALASVRAPARAQGTEPPALFREGVALREAGDTAGAIDRLRVAHRIAPDHRTAYNLAAALADAGRVVEARSLLRRVLAEPEDLLLVDAARDLLSAITARIASVSLSIDGVQPGQRLLVDGREAEPGPGRARAVSLDPGRHRFEVRDRDGALLARSELEVGEGERRSLVLRPVAPPVRAAARAAVAQAAVDPGAQGGDETWLWVGIGAGIVAVATVVAVIVAVALGGQSGSSVDGALPEVIVRGDGRE